MSGGYEILTLREVEAAPHRGSSLIPVRHLLGYRPAGVNAWRADKGGQLIPPHEEDGGHEELYVVVSGRASFTLGEKNTDAPAGTLVFVEAGAYRTAVAEEDGTIVFVVGAGAGEAFEAEGWDTFAVADGYRQAGRVSEGRAVVEQLIAASPDHWGIIYNAGCFEALAGNADAAFDHLRRVLELAPEEAAPYLREDRDLDSIRDDPRFQELLG